MISIPNSTIEVPNYAEKATLERLSTPVVRTAEQREKGLRCCAKLRAIVNGQVKVNYKAIQNQVLGKQQAEHIAHKELVNDVAKMTPAQLQELAL